MIRKFAYSLGVAFIVIVLGVSAQAQTVGSILGTVTDPTGAVITNCQVTVTAVETGLTRTASCGKSGYYVVPSLEPAHYQVTVTAPGFVTLIRKSIVLQANQPLTIDLKLSIGSANQTVTVNTAAVQVNTTTATLSQVIDRSSMVELPLDGRNAATLTTLVAGAVTAPDAGATQGLTIPVDVSVSVNGSTGNQTSYWLDGASNTDILTNVNAPFPFPDALQEFSVQTSNYSARYGEGSGAVVNIASKSGTNAFHGDVFEFARNPAFNATGYFNSQKDQLRRHQFGFTLGGPVWLPKIYDGRNRTFFFGGYQKTIIHNTNGAAQGFAPTTANDGGDFSALLSATNPDNPLGYSVVLTNPLTGLPYSPLNIIPKSQLDPAYLALTKYFPPSSTNGFVHFVTPDDEDYTEGIGRVDQKLTNKDQLTVRHYYYGYTIASTFVPGNFLSMSSGRYITDNNFMAKEVHVFNPNLLNDVHFSILAVNGADTPPAGIPTYSSLGVKLNQDFKGPGNSGMYAYGFFYAGGSWPTIWDRETYQYGDDLHWIHGKHSFGFGALVMRGSYTNTNDIDQGPYFQFDGHATGFSGGDLAIGTLSLMNQASPTLANFVTTQTGFYAQDDYHASQRLTLNLGLRYQPFLPFVETHGEVSRFSPSAYAAGTISTQFPNAPPGVSYPGDPGFPDKSGVDPNYIGFAPRLGFAYDIFGNGKASIRGGFGMFYNSTQVADDDNSFIGNPFIYKETNIDPPGPFSNPYQGITDPFPAPPPGPGATFPAYPTLFTYDPFHRKYQTPVTYQYNLTMERQLTENLLFRIGYVGSHGSHGQENWELNPSIYIPGSTLPTNSRRLYPGWGNINDLVNDVNSSYNSLQVGFQRRVSKGFSLMANYTWSKALDDLPEAALVDSNLDAPTIPWYMPNFHRLEYGPANWDRTNIFVASYVWQLPGLSGSNRLIRAALGNWENTGIVTWQSGPPFTVFASGDASKTNIKQDRAVVTGNPYGGDACAVLPGSSCKNWLNPASFAAPATGTFGDAQKGQFRGPGYFDFDTGFFKNIPINQRINGQFRAEFFNVFNNTEYSAPNANVNGTALGAIITQANSPRVVQFAAKIKF